MESKKINQLATSVSPQTSDLTIIGDPITGVSKKISLLQIANLFATTGTVSSVAVTETGDALTITGSPITSTGTINIGFAGAANQYVRGDGALADFPTSTGGGSSVSYYLNSSVSQGTIGGVAYREFSKDPIAGAGTDITATTNGYIASYITDANDPALLEVPAGNFNCEFYFSVNSDAHNPYVYAEIYKYDGSTFTLIGSSQSVPEYLTNGTTISPYYFAIPVTQTALTLTDRIAIRIYANVDTREITLHTENNHLCQVVTTFSKGLTSLNNLTRQVQFLATGTSGTDFNIVSTGDTHTFNIPSASASNRGLITTGAQTIAGSKTFSSAISADAGVLLKNGFTTYSNAYTSLSGDVGSLVISGSISSTPFDNVLAFAPLTSNTYTFPDVTGTIALLEGTQTFSGIKTFSENPIINGTGTNSAYTILQSAGTNKWRIGNNYASGVNTFDIFAYDNSSTPLSINSNGAMTLSANVTTTGAQFVQNGFYLTNANGGSLAGYTHMWARNEGINFGLRNGTGGASFIFPSANSYNYTFPAASGTISLTSDLSAYLPLTGGTLTGALSGTSATFSGDLIIDTNTLYVDSTNNRVGIGGTPTTKFELFGSIGNFQIASSGAEVFFTRNENNDFLANGGSSAGIRFGGQAQLRFATGTSLTTRLTIDSTGAATFSSSVGIGGSTITDGHLLNIIGSSASSNVGIVLNKTNSTAQIWGITNIGALTFYDYTNSAERMRITSSGNVGIGTSSPSRKLVIVGGNGNQLELDNTGQTYVQQFFKINGTEVGTFYASNTEFGMYTYGSQLISFSTNNTERMRITSEGRVGIGQTAPGIALSVAGQSEAWQFGVTTATGTAGALIGSPSANVLAFGNWSGSEKARILPDGQFCMNTTTALTAGWLCIAVASDNYNAIVLKDTGTSYSSGNYYQVFTNSSNTISGSISHPTATTVSFNTSSDYRLKEDLKDFNGLDILSNIKFYDFKWKDEDKRMHGVIAHELETLLPLAVSGTKDAIDEDGNIVSQGVDYSKLVPILGKAIQEQQAQIEELKAKILSL